VFNESERNAGTMLESLGRYFQEHRQEISNDLFQTLVQQPRQTPQIFELDLARD